MYSPPPWGPPPPPLLPSLQPSSMKIVQLVKHEPDAVTGPVAVTSVAWSGRGGHLATGWAAGNVTLFDATTRQPVRVLTGHKSRVTAMSWGAHVLATGGKDKTVYLRDMRSPAQYAAKLAGHRAEICGLRFSPDWQLLASGANDNLVNVWSHHMVGSTYSLGRRAGAEGGSGGADAGAAPAPATLWKFTQHRSAVKAMAWSPHAAGLLATGGGRDDKQIRLFSTATGEMLDAVDTGSQVCTLAWAPGVNEIVSTHGYVNHAVAVWRYPTMARVCALYGHAARVLHSALSPDGTSLVTGAADNTLRFWELFPPAPGVDPVDYRGLSGGASTEAGTATLVSPMRAGAARGVAEIR
jgi:cell division cycle 20-like protein 1, cofactor of APC complex